MKKAITILLFFSFNSSFSQELFPQSEPASTSPKNVLGLRYTYEVFRDTAKNSSYWHGIRIIYGPTTKLTLMGTLSASNHHLSEFPKPLSNNNFGHHHSPVTTTPGLAPKKNSMLFEGFHLYGKYRFLSLDGPNKHFRLALYGEASKTFVANDEAEPFLMADNSGIGGGLIITKLHKKLAISGTTGFIKPFKYKEKDEGLDFRSGDGWINNISFGYLLLPRKYKSYKDINVNLYLEFFNKTFGQAKYFLNDQLVDVSDKPTLQKGSYSEIRPAVQFIFNSINRLDLSVSYSLYQKISGRLYPIYLVNFQRYFYSNKKKS